LTPTPRIPKIPYNRSKKRARAQDSDKQEEGLLVPKKINLRVVITGLSDEIGKARRARESFLTNQQKAIQLLEREYKNRLPMLVFIQACTFFKDEGNATNFITLTDP